MSGPHSRIPSALARYFADSHIVLVSWTGSELTLKITKDIGPEEGLLVFAEVSHVNLPSGLTVDGIRAAETNELPAEFFDRYRPEDRRLDPGEAVYFISTSGGTDYFVIATMLSYSISG
jgi:hypothetical protein